MWASELGYYQSVPPHTYVTWDTISRFFIQIAGRQSGLLGILIVLSLFILMTWCGLRLIKRNPGRLQRNLATAMLLLLVLPGYLGLLRTLNLLPVLPSYVIPFMGYGSQALITTLIAMVLVMASGRYSDP